MTASEIKAVIAGFVVVSGVGIGAILWRQQHPDQAEIARLETPAPASQPALSPVPSKPQAPQKQPEASKPAVLQPKGPDLGVVPTPQKPAEPAAGRGEPPHFDVVRVEPTGEAVIAGKGDPNAKIELLGSGKVIGETTADATGHFVVIPSDLSPGNYDLALRQTTAGHPVTQSTQSVAVSVPARGGQVVVALAEPGKPTKLISGPPQAPAAAPPAAAGTPPAQVALAKPATSTPVPAKPEAPPPEAAAKPAGPGLAIRSVELENGNGFFASGAAAPGTHVEVYLNGSHLAEVVAGPDGQWSVTIRKGLTGGHYAVRADATGDNGDVTARAEVPFDVPVAMAEAPKMPAPATPAAPPTTPPAPIASSATAPEPPSAPNPSEIAGLGPEQAPPAAGVPTVTDTPDTAPKPPSALPPVVEGAPEQPLALPPTTTPKPAAAPLTPAAVPPVAAARPEAAPPTLTAAAPVVPKQAEAGPTLPSAHAVIDEIETALVVRGDNLWNISRARLGHGRRFTEVYAANVSQIRDPKLIYPGQVFVVPSSK